MRALKGCHLERLSGGEIRREPLERASTLSSARLALPRHVDLDTDQYDPSYPGHEDWPRHHYTNALIQADGDFSLERSSGNCGDHGDLFTGSNGGVGPLGLTRDDVPSEKRQGTSTSGYGSGALKNTGIIIDDVETVGETVSFRVDFDLSATREPTSAPTAAPARPPTPMPDACEVTDWGPWGECVAKTSCEPCDYGATTTWTRPSTGAFQGPGEVPEPARLTPRDAEAIVAKAGMAEKMRRQASHYESLLRDDPTWRLEGKARRDCAWVAARARCDDAPEARSRCPESCGPRTARAAPTRSAASTASGAGLGPAACVGGDASGSGSTHCGCQVWSHPSRERLRSDRSLH